MNKTFCVMPFYGAEYEQQGMVRHCCFMQSDADIHTVRTQMLQGKRPQACQTCWSLEDQGVTSDRQLKNSAYDKYANKDIRFVEQDCQQGKFSTQIIKLYTSNLCNSTCFTCDSKASTSWGQLLGEKRFVQINQNILDDLPYKDLVMLTFVGGEPLYDNKNFKILENLLKVNNTNCFISFTTNGSITFTAQQRQILCQFNRVNAAVSIDGIKSRFEYIRYPLSWKKLLDNLDIYKQLGFDICASYTLSNLNIIYYDETIEWFKQQNLPYNHNLVLGPDYLTVNALPKNIKENCGEAKKFFREHCLKDDIDFLHFCREVKKQDQLKGINICQYMPKMAKNIL
jgi:organic radical activating enzyme